MGLHYESEKSNLHACMLLQEGLCVPGVSCRRHKHWCLHSQQVPKNHSLLACLCADKLSTKFDPSVCAGGAGVHVVDSVSWPAPCAIAASSLWYDEDADEEEEDENGYLLGITWDSWQETAAAQPQGLAAKLTSYVTVAVSQAVAL